MNCLGNESVDETLQLHHMKYASMYKDEELQGNCINASTVCLCLLILIWHVEMLKVKNTPTTHQPKYMSSVRGQN